MENKKVVSIDSNEALEKQLSKYKLKSVVASLVGVSGLALSTLTITDQDMPSFVGLLIGPLLISTGASGFVSSLDNYQYTKEEIKSVKRR